MKKKIYIILFFVSFIVSFYILGAYEQNFIKDKLMVIIVLISLGIAALSAYKLGVVTIPDKEEVTSYKGSLLALLMIISAILIAGALDKKEADKPADTYTQTESAQPVEVSTESIVEQESLIDTPTYYKEPVIIENKELLARVVFAEAGNQPYIGKLMVAATIKNRSEQWWFTPEEIVCAEGQYAKPYDLSKITTARQQQQYVDCLKAIDEVFSNDNTYDNVLYFCNPKICEKVSLKWFEDNLELVCIVGDHNFYKNKGEDK